MKKLKSRLILWGTYVTVFLIALMVTCAIQNRDITTGGSSQTQMRLPVIYVSSDGGMINPMNAYVSEIDCGYLRNGVAVLDGGRSIDLAVRENGNTIEEMSYRLSDAANKNIIEEGIFSQEENGDIGKIWRLTLKNSVIPEREYCLTIILKCSESQEFYFYTRVIDGQDYNLLEKLDFVWNFNKMTFDREMSGTIKSYLSTSALNDDSTYTNIDIHSGSDAVMWGRLSPSVTGNMLTTVKAISKDAATIQLLYKVQIYEDNKRYKEYYVKEYYTVQKREDIWHLKDFQRSMCEIPGSASFEVSGNSLNLGITSEKASGFMSSATDSGHAAMFIMDGQLWYYDVTNNIMTCVLNLHDRGAESVLGNYPYGIKPLDFDADGTAYFMVYGYMPGGVHTGENGIAVYVYNPDTNVVTEQAFIPSDKGYEVLRLDVEKLAFMDDDHQLYLCLGDIVYRIDYEAGSVREVIDQLNINHYKLSADGTMVAMPDSSDTGLASSIEVYFLDRGEMKTITAEGKVLKLIGFFNNDIVYAAVNPDEIYEDGVGLVTVPMDTLYIADRDLNVVKEYTSDGKHIMDVKLGDNSISISLAKEVQKDGKTVYEATEGDTLVSNASDEVPEVHVSENYDSVMKNELYIQMPSSVYAAPLRRTAILEESDESVFSVDTRDDQVQKYYLYTGNGLYKDYTNIVEAIDACTQPTGIVVSENKEIVWQSIRPAEYRTDFESIEKGEMIPTIVKAICEYAEGNTQISIDGSQRLSQALSANLTQHQVVSLKGLSIDDVLYFVYQDRPVIAQLHEGEFVIIVGYNDYYLQIADPTTGEVGDWNYKVFSEAFENEGNIFLSYY